MKYVFAFFHDKFRTEAAKAKIIADAFKKNSLIFVPVESNQDPKKSVQGKFFSMKDVCWNDPSDVTRILQQTRKYTPRRQLLSTYYKESHDFLRLQLKVDLTPNADEYIEMAVVLVKESSVPTPAVIEPILEIFAVLGEKCKIHQPNTGCSDANESMHTIDPKMAQFLQQRLKEEAIFPCGKKWLTLSEKPIISDNKQLKKIFENEKGVYFITLESSHFKPKSRGMTEKKRHQLVEMFLSACGIAKISMIVEEKLVSENLEFQCYDTQMYFHKVSSLMCDHTGLFLFIMCHMFSHKATMKLYTHL